MGTIEDLEARIETLERKIEGMIATRGRTRALQVQLDTIQNDMGVLMRAYAVNAKKDAGEKG